MFPFDSDPDTRVVLQYYLYRAAANPGFFYPIYILFMVDVNDLSYTAVGVIGTAQAIVVLTGEVPTGYVGDRIGRRNSLVVAQGLFLVSTASFLVVTDLLGFLFTFGTLSLATTFISGSGQAWLYDTLAERLDTDEFTRVQGRGSAASKWSMAVTMIAGGLLYVENPVYPFVAGLALQSVSFVLVLSLPKNRQYRSGEGEPDETHVEGSAGEQSGETTSEDEPDTDDHEVLTVFDTLPLIRDQLSRPPLRSFVVFTALYGGLLMTADAYIQPVTLDAIRGSLDAALASIGFPEPATLGFLYSAFTVVSAIASDRAEQVESVLGTRTALLGIPALIAGLFLLPVVVPVLAFPMFFVMKGGGAIFHPISGQYLNDRLESVGRATVLSTVSMLSALSRIPFAVGSGVVADVFDARMAVAALGGTFVVCAGLVQIVGSGVASDARHGTLVD
ncbi:MFS transporter [Salinirubrum litoreum]|uniref:MFS transporter n=1 Tax=Salinirubrum litoreum TaxID=1126234 RepID=A0ABD5R9T9_9EURY|nr:MFS transporter [Salinirubrum litoreum]